MVWLIVAAGLLLVAAANAHLVYVAMSSQPDCVTHVRPGEATAASGAFSAARSACAPPAPKSTMHQNETRS
jgi:hypothetical protein